MVSHYLGKEEVSAYLRDFLDRLGKLQAVPTVWCPLTRSGEAVFSQLVDVAASWEDKLLDTVSVLPVRIDHSSNKLTFIEGDPAKDLQGKDVLIFDGAIHSGRMMSNCVSEVLRYGPPVCVHTLLC